MTRYVIGVDLGGTHLRTALMTEAGQVVSQLKRKTLADEGPEAVIGRIAEGVNEIAREAPDGQLSGVGIAAPGPVDAAAGLVYSPPNLPGWGVVPLAEHLRVQTKLPIFLGNDANLAALGESVYGAGTGRTDLVYLTISTGIGSGIVSGGQLLLGTRGLAAEAGHIQVLPDGPLCGCGFRGHLEALASGPAIARMTAGLLRAGQPSRMTLDPDGTISMEQIVAAGKEGDALAIRAIGTAGRYIGMAISLLVHLLAPSRFIIGGGVTNAGDLLFDPIRTAAYGHVLAAYSEDFDIVPAALGDDAGIMGAGALALQRTI